MDRITVADAARSRETLLQILDNAYWEASDLAPEDVIYDIISYLPEEVSELANRGTDDTYMAFEPITAACRKSHIKLKTLQTNLQHWVLRSSTASHLEQELPAVMQLLNLR